VPPVQPHPLSQDLLSKDPGQLDRSLFVAAKWLGAGSLALALLALAQRPEPACAQVAEPSMGSVEVVLDASAGMRGRLGDAEAMAVAKEFVRVLRAELAGSGAPPPLGLRVYGAASPRAQRDCRDTRLAVRHGEPQADFGAALSSLQPMGVSPLAFALESALADSARTYVLITGGSDTCGGDACAVWRGAVTPGTNRTARIHVVAVGVQPQDVDRLRCVSRAGSGAFLTIRDPSEVAAVARRLALILKNQGALDVRLSIGERETFPAAVRLLVPRTRRVAAAFTARGPRAVPAGIYDLIIEAAPPIVVGRVMILPGETVTIARSDFGRLEVEMRDSDDRPLRQPVVIHAPGRRTEVRYGSTGESLVLQSGTYDVSVDLGDSLVLRRGVIVSTGRTTKLTLGGRGTVRIVSPEFDDPPSTRAVLTRAGTADSLLVGQTRTMPSGRYRLRVQTLPVFVSDDVVVDAGETTTIELPPLGLLRLELIGPDGPITGQPAELREPLTLERYGAIASGEPRLVMPGTYQLELGTAPPQTVADVMVRPGEETVVERRGLARILVVPPEGATASYRLEVLHERTGQRLAERSGPSPTMAALPGVYRARVWRGAALLWDSRINVASDKPARIDLPRP
jgi:hypothetical protein